MGFGFWDLSWMVENLRGGGRKGAGGCECCGLFGIALVVSWGF